MVPPNNHIAIVSHVNPFEGSSGQEKRVFNTLLALCKEWNKVTLFTLPLPASSFLKSKILQKFPCDFQLEFIRPPRYAKFLSLWAPLYFLLGHGKKSNLMLPVFFKNLPKAIASNKYDVILFEYWHLYKTAEKIRPFTKILACDTHNILLNTFKIHTNQKKFLPKWYKNRLIRRYRDKELKALSVFDLIISINSLEEKYFKEHLKNKKICYFPMGVLFPPRKYAIKKDFTHNTIAYYGGLGNKKNEKDALQVIDAVIHLQKEGKEVKLKIIGSNPSENLIKITERYPFIQTTGFVKDLEKTFLDVDLAVIPFTGTYGFRSRIIELMYFGIPVLTTQDAIWGMEIEANKEILIMSPTNSLKDQIFEILNNKTLLKSVSKNAIEKAESVFSFENTYLKFAKDLKTFIQ